jgi:hypothetical protein
VLVGPVVRVGSSVGDPVKDGVALVEGAGVLVHAATSTASANETERRKAFKASNSSVRR